MTNEAAERLLYEVLHATRDKGSLIEPVWRKRFDEALAAERRPLLEILRRAAAGWEVGPGPHTVPLSVVNEIVTVLHDAEADR